MIGNANQVPGARLKFGVASHHILSRIHRHGSAKYASVDGVVVFFHLNFLHQILPFRFSLRSTGLGR